MPHEVRVAAVGDDEKEEWVVFGGAFWGAAIEELSCSCSGGLYPFFVHPKEKFYLFDRVAERATRVCIQRFV